VLGVEPICRVLQVAPSSYYAAKKRAPSARARREEVLKAAIVAVLEGNYRCYGARKVWRQLRREGTVVAPLPVERLMRALGLTGLVRGQGEAHHDHRCRGGPTSRPGGADFGAPAPNRLWVADLTYIRTWSGWVYAAFVIDVYFRQVVGWQIATHLRTDLALDALEMAISTR